jgi:L-threonylcarbamoyladenylate synthase
LETLLLATENTSQREENILKAAEIIKRGGLVAIPTETVYGLGASALDEDAVKRIFEVKGRPQDNPLIIHVEGAGALNKWCRNVPDTAFRLAEMFWPGPLTMVLPKNDLIPSRVTAGMDTVAVRCPDHPATLRLIETSGVPIAAPSANISGKPSPTSAEHVMHDISGKIEAVLDGGECRVGLESTIIDLSVTPPRLLRPGGVSLEELRAALGEVSVDPAVFRKLEAGEKPKAPGMKYTHYSPEAEVLILKGSLSAAENYVSAHYEKGTAVLCFDGEESAFKADICLSYGAKDDSASQARLLFARLRELDRSDIKRIYARAPESEGVGLAVFNRLSKAAGNTIIEVS